VEPSVDGAFFAKATSGFSGADIQNMVNMSILNAVKNKRKLANV
jgi:ATP-dependent metalloprotease